MTMNLKLILGLQVTYNVSLPEGHRITSVNIGEKGSNNPLDDDQMYTVAAPSFLADGGDGYVVNNAIVIVFKDIFCYFIFKISFAHYHFLG